MSDQLFIADKIKRLSEALQRAEEFYHEATIHGSIGDRQAALFECQRIRKELDAEIKRLCGGNWHESIEN